MSSYYRICSLTTCAAFAQVDDGARALLVRCKLSSNDVAVSVRGTVRVSLQGCRIGACSLGSFHAGPRSSNAIINLVNSSIYGAEYWVENVRPGVLGKPSLVDWYTVNARFLPGEEGADASWEEEDEGGGWAVAVEEEAGIKDLMDELDAGTAGGDGGEEEEEEAAVAAAAAAAEAEDDEEEEQSLQVADDYGDSGESSSRAPCLPACLSVCGPVCSSTAWYPGHA